MRVGRHSEISRERLQQSSLALALQQTDPTQAPSISGGPCETTRRLAPAFLCAIQINETAYAQRSSRARAHRGVHKTAAAACVTVTIDSFDVRAHAQTHALALGRASACAYRCVCVCVCAYLASRVHTFKRMHHCVFARPGAGSRMFTCDHVFCMLACVRACVYARLRRACAHV
eukprot:5520760-Pleurochrysis_carterae.AAC.2